MLKKALLAFLLATTLFSFDTNLSIEQKLIYLSYKEKPEILYKNQIVQIDYKAIIVDSFSEINTDFSNFYGLKLLNKNPSWKLEESNKYSLTLYAKVLKERLKMPDLTVTIYNENNESSREIFGGKYEKSFKIAKNEKFIGLISPNLSVTNHKIEKFNAGENIFTLEMSGMLTNFEDINISFASQQGFDSLETDYPYSNMFYYAVIPNDLKEFGLLSFNPKTGDFVNHKIELDFSNFGQKISTQIDLNPNKKKFPFLEVAVISVLVIFILILLLKTRHWIFLVILAAIIGVSSFILLKETKVRIYIGSSVYLLPIENSTLFYKTDRDILAVKLKENNTHIKVLLPDENVGWIRKEDVSPY